MGARPLPPENGGVNNISPEEGASMDVEIRHVTADAETRTALLRMEHEKVNFPVPDLALVPLQGDLISYGNEDDARTFEVINRLFIWVDPQHLVLQLQLQVVPRSEAPQRPHLQAV
jgi:hypothetical protein